jgi:hypothetical protein
MKVEDSEILLSNVANGGNGNASFQLDFPAMEVKDEIYESIVDELDHVVLKERQRMLLARYFSLCYLSPPPLSLSLSLSLSAGAILTQFLYLILFTSIVLQVYHSRGRIS